MRLDQGKCVLCGRCVAARPDVFGWTDGPAAAALSRGGLVVPEVAETPDRLAALRNGLKTKTSALRRSVHLRHVDAGSDGSEEWEILALLNPVYDVAPARHLLHREPPARGHPAGHRGRGAAG